MSRLFAPHRDTTAVNDIAANADGSFTIDDLDLETHLLRFGWSHEDPHAAARFTSPDDVRAAEGFGPLPLPNLKDMRKADLVALAEARGVSAEGTAKDIKARLRIAAGQAPQPGDDDPTDD